VNQWGKVILKSMPKNPNIYIRRVLLTRHKELYNISAHKRKPFSLFMKEMLTNIVNSYPINIKDVCVDNSETQKIVIPEISEKTATELKNICDHLNVDISQFLKIEMYRSGLGYPVEMKTKPALQAYPYKLE